MRLKINNKNKMVKQYQLNPLIIHFVEESNFFGFPSLLHTLSQKTIQKINATYYHEGKLGVKAYFHNLIKFKKYLFKEEEK